MQIMNPKATLGTLPIATINFPTNNIIGIKIAIASFVLAVLAFFAPFRYSFLGQYFGTKIKNDKIIKAFNTVMALLLIYVAFTIFRDHVYLVYTGVNEF